MSERRAKESVAATAAAAPEARTRHPQRVYFEAMEECLASGMTWLDLGCGRHLVPDWIAEGFEIEARLRRRAGAFVGIDLDREALRENESCMAVVAAAGALPFAGGSFDLVTSNMVFEHVSDPASALAEIRRILRPGGTLLVHTPSLFDIVTIAARLVPNSLHPLIVARLEGRAEEDVYPTYFAFNRRRRVDALLRQAGLVPRRIEYLEHPDAYGRIPVLAWIESGWHRLAAHVPPMRGTLLIQAEAVRGPERVAA